MIEYNGIPFYDFIKNAILQLIFFLLLATAIYYLTLSVTGSHFYSLIFTAVFLLMRQLLFGGGIKKRVRQIDSLFNGAFPESEKVSLAEAGDEWLKGIGFINDMNQPIWIRFCGDYFEFFFLARSRQPPYKINFNEIERIVLAANDGLADIKFKNLKNIDVIIPWSESWDSSLAEKIKRVSSISRA